MRVAHLADIHLDTPFALLAPQLARNRRQGIRNALKAALEEAANRTVDAVFIAGDLYEHERIAPDTGEFLRQAFAELAPTPILLAPGNHDWYGPESLYARADWSPNVHVFEKEVLEHRQLEDGLHLWGAAHHGPAVTRNFLAGFRVEGEGVHVALLHGAEQSALVVQAEDGKAPYGPFRADQISESGLSHVFTGHLHTPIDAAEYTYPGNPEPLAFGEAEAPIRGLVIATIREDGFVERERVRVAQTQVCDRDVDLTGCTNADEACDRVREKLAGLSGYARLTVNGEVAPEVDISLADLERAAEWLEAVVVRQGQLGVAYDIETIKTKPTVRGQFVSDVLAADLPNELRQKALITGLRALAGRPDLEVV